MASARNVGGLPACGFLVAATKGGQVPIAIEKRAKNKKVTVVSNVQGNARALCTALTTLLGIGGTTHERGPKVAEVEVQGEQVARVTAALLQLGCLRGLARNRQAAASVVERERDAASDVLLDATRERKPRHAQQICYEPPPLDAPCRRWHGEWLYCRGRCEQPDGSDVWDMSCLALPPKTYNPPSRDGRDSLEKMLRGLGMLAEPGEAVREWIAAQQLRQEDTARRRIAPQASRCTAPSKAASKGHFLCKECGAVFSLERTLKKHLQLHKDEREGIARTLPSAASSATTESAWRQSTHEETAVFDAAGEEEWWDEWDEWADEADYEERPVPQNTASLSSWITSSVDMGKHGYTSQAQTKRDKRKPDSCTGVVVACPICGESFPQEKIEGHVDVCLTTSQSPRAATSSARETACVNSRSNCSDVQLPQELLESLLDLDLSADAAERFWEHYEADVANAGASVQDAFLSALQAILNEDPLEHRVEGGEEPFADEENICPVCGKSFALLSTASIAQHVEDCLNASIAPARGGDIQMNKKTAFNAAAQPPTQTPSAEVETATHVPSDDFNVVRPRRAKRWDASSRNAPNGDLSALCSQTASSPSHRASPLDDVGCRVKGGVQLKSAKCPPVRALPTWRAQSTVGCVMAPEKNSTMIVSRPHKLDQVDQQPIGSWLREALMPLLDRDAVEAVLAGVDVVLGCTGDADAAENAADLLAAELPAGSVVGDAVLMEFKKRVAAVA